jgi:hypothetical protein
MRKTAEKMKVIKLGTGPEIQQTLMSYLIKNKCAYAFSILAILLLVVACMKRSTATLFD